MKRCPTCQRIYADETLNFCLEDGATLHSATGTTTQDETLALNANEPPPTEILPPGLAPTIRAQKPPTTVRQEGRATRHEFQDLAAPSSVKQRNTTSVVALTVVATILLLALGGLGAWLLLRDNTSSGNLNGDGVRTDSIPGNINTRPSATPTPIASATPTPQLTPQPTPQQTPTTNDPSAARTEVSNALNGWRQTMINPSVDAHMSYYASTLHTYYNARDVGVSRVRANVARAFSTYSTFDVRITNLQIAVDPSGETAVATFDKTFEFSNSEKRYAGSGLNRFWFEKIGGRWLITGEKDLKTYY